MTGKRIILTSGSALAPAGAEGVFFDRESLRGGSLPALPDGLSGRLHFVHEGIAWTGKGRKRRAAPGSGPPTSSTTTAPTRCSMSWPRP
ncbi:hypothetical protein GCM10009654_15600 [Streptomyces hebeiensis]|uniref:Deacetylase sirtuin-type domain-containing protein n=1 Tax=Streptomyces hebeiensis TaxID=229486 RepID=A0ABP4F7U1_9ACTN